MSDLKKPQRRLSRVACMQYLYSWSINRPNNLADDLRLFFANLEEERDFYAFGEELIHGTIDNVETIDARLSDMARNWDFARIAKIDLAILRMAFFELLFRKDIPPVVSINEAIDLSKNYSSAEARRFINGILDKLRGELDRPSRAASGE